MLVIYARASRSENYNWRAMHIPYSMCGGVVEREFRQNLLPCTTTCS